MKSGNAASAKSNAITELIENYIRNIKLEALRPGVRVTVEGIIAAYMRSGYLSKRQFACLKKCCISSNIGTNRRNTATWYSNRKIGNPIG